MKFLETECMPKTRANQTDDLVPGREILEYHSGKALMESKSVGVDEIS